MISLTNHPIGTYAKLLIQNNPTLVTIINDKTRYVKEQIHGESNTEIILTDQQINDALNGPFQSFFKCYLNALAKIAKVTLALNLSNDDLFKEKDFEEPVDHGIPAHLLATLDFSTINQVEKSFTENVREHFVSLEAIIDDWTQSVLSAMQQHQIPLSDREIQDFAINEPISELNNRFIDLKLELPKLKKGPFDFQEYFTLKSTLAIQSALGRSHQASTSAEINTHLQKLKSPLSSVFETEEKLVAQLKDDLETLLKPIVTA